MEPLLFLADYKDRVWGGEKLRTIFGKEIPNAFTGESWEVASHENGSSVVMNGVNKGKTLTQVIHENPEGIVGPGFQASDKFPLLIKFIDAKDRLSVQVHPEDAYAMLHENGELGKSEAWYILEADPGAKLIAGLVDGITKEQFTQALENNQLESVLNEIPVKKGDVVDIPAGFIHAIEEGILLAEVQQNSDTTYRVYDWNRVGLDGVARDLHVKQSLDVIDFEGKFPKELVKGIKVAKEGYEQTTYVINRYFALEEVQVTTAYIEKNKPNHFEIFMCLEGDFTLQWQSEQLPIQKGQSFMIPAGMKAFELIGQGLLVKTFVPDVKAYAQELVTATGTELEALKAAVRIEDVR